jgi:hypothetical protein
MNSATIYVLSDESISKRMAKKYIFSVKLEFEIQIYGIRKQKCNCDNFFWFMQIPCKIIF